MLEWLQAATGAHWMVLGLALLIAEVIVPGAFIMWFGFGALATGLLATLFPALGWQVEALLFVALSVGSILLFRQWRLTHPSAPSDQPLLNNRVAGLIGRVFDLSHPIVNGRGKLTIGDALWTVTGPDLPIGCKVRISAAHDLMLVVEPVAS